MIDDETNRRLFEQRQQREQLVLLDLDLQKQPELDQILQQRRGVAIIVGAVKRDIEGDADDAGRLQPFELLDVDVILDDRHALEPALTEFDCIEQDAAVRPVAGIGSDDQGVPDIEDVQNANELRRGRDFLSARTIGGIGRIGKTNGIDRVNVAVDLWACRYRHRRTAPPTAPQKVASMAFKSSGVTSGSTPNQALNASLA